jgi:hypothetical protein
MTVGTVFLHSRNPPLLAGHQVKVIGTDALSPLERSSCQEVCKKSSGGSNSRRLRYPFSVLELNAQVNLSHELRCVEPSEVLLCDEK